MAKGGAAMIEIICNGDDEAKETQKRLGRNDIHMSDARLSARAFLRVLALRQFRHVPSDVFSL